MSSPNPLQTANEHSSVDLNSTASNSAESSANGGIALLPPNVVPLVGGLGGHQFDVSGGLSSAASSGSASSHSSSSNRDCVLPHQRQAHPFAQHPVAGGVQYVAVAPPAPQFVYAAAAPPPPPPQFPLQHTGAAIIQQQPGQQPAIVPLLRSGHNGSGHGAGITARTANLMVNYIPTACDEAMLRDIFSRCGEVAEVKIVKSPATLESRGFGFVRYVNPADALKAIDQLNGHQIFTKRLKVGFAMFGAGSGVGSASKHAAAAAASAAVPMPAGVVPVGYAAGGGGAVHYVLPAQHQQQQQQFGYQQLAFLPAQPQQQQQQFGAGGFIPIGQAPQHQAGQFVQYVQMAPPAAGMVQMQQHQFMQPQQNVQYVMMPVQQQQQHQQSAVAVPR